LKITDDLPIDGLSRVQEASNHDDVIETVRVDER
jgi:hypothetical protein